MRGLFKGIEMGEFSGVIQFEGKTYEVRHGESALEALLRGGAVVPFSCRKGTCHSCMMQVTSGSPGAQAVRGLDVKLQKLGLFTPCLSHVRGKLAIQRPDSTRFWREATLHSKTYLGAEVWQLRLEPMSSVTWKAGQFLNIRGPQGHVRSYSLVSTSQENYFLEVHVKHTPGGQVSPWLTQGLEPQEAIAFQGPMGSCVYGPSLSERPLLLLGAGTGMSPLVGVAGDALRAGHTAGIHLYHGSSDCEGQYLKERLNQLVSSNQNCFYTPCISSERVKGREKSRRAPDVAFAEHPDLGSYSVLLCGQPAMVYESRVRALVQGARRPQVLADPFEPSWRVEPEDKAAVDAIVPDTELWQALGHGEMLTSILEDFYRQVYADERLAPFFHRVTIERAIGKQYEFICDLLTGSRTFFGPRPFNAHHWMVISDELFDYREELLFSCMLSHGLPQRLACRWTSLHERFRQFIVKSSPRGLILNGEEVMLEGFDEEVLAIGAMCDGCQLEIPSGARGRMHRRTGELFCQVCEAPEHPEAGNAGSDAL